MSFFNALLPATNLISGEWRYKGEGAQNMIFEYVGSEDKAQYLHTVLRLSKCQTSRSNCQKTNKCENNYHFLKNSIQPRLCKDVIVLGELVPVHATFLEELSKCCRHLRPQHRLETELDLQASLGCLMPDLSYLPVGSEMGLTIDQICVEIKPKSGILPSKDCLSSDTLIKSEVSRFRMMQQLKILEGKVHSASQYDPLDLFSGNRQRMVLSIEALIHEPQNNFRLSINQRDMISSSNRLDNIQMERLASAFGSTVTVSDLSKLLVSILLDCGVLEDIKKLQELDRYDIESVGPMFRHIQNPTSFSASEARRLSPCSRLPHASFTSPSETRVALFGPAVC